MPAVCCQHQSQFVVCLQRVGQPQLAAGGADAGVTLACPLNMPLASGNLKRWFHANVYDRAIARSLSSKIAEWQHLFRDGSGASRPVACWEGFGEGTFVADESVLTICN